MTGEERTLEEARRAAFAVAYRMLGTVADSEDIAQEAALRLHRAAADGARVASPRAYVVTVATRLAIDELRSARARRETYVGEWLPEPLVDDHRVAEDPARHAEMADSLSLAFLVLLERLTPEQRAALLLHDVFDYGYGEVAEVLGTSEANARQLCSRARRAVGEHRPRFEPSASAREELARRFLAAAQEGDVDALESLLAHDVVLRGDGGGKAPALARSLHGRDRVTRTLRAWLRQLGRVPGAGLRPADVNGGPGVVLADGTGAVIGVMALEIAGDEIRGVNSVVNPDKLRHVGELADLPALGARLRRRP